MNPEFMSHKGKPQFNIASVLNGHALKARKLNNSFLYHNTRMIALQENGMLVYYSKFTKSAQNTAKKLKGKPKSGVYFNQVLFSCIKVNEKEVELLVKFRAYQQYSFDGEHISFVKDPKSQKVVLWVFLIQLQPELLSATNKQLKVTDSISILQMNKCNNDERTWKSALTSIIPTTQTDKISIDNVLFQKKQQRSRKHVQWLDLQQSISQKKPHLGTTMEGRTQSGNQFSESWDVSEENSNLKVYTFQTVCQRASQFQA